MFGQVFVVWSVGKGFDPTTAPRSGSIAFIFLPYRAGEAQVAEILKLK